MVRNAARSEEEPVVRGCGDRQGCWETQFDAREMRENEPGTQRSVVSYVGGSSHVFSNSAQCHVLTVVSFIFVL
jgi:hypothetical protein